MNQLYPLTHGHGYGASRFLDVIRSAVEACLYRTNLLNRFMMTAFLTQPLNCASSHQNTNHQAVKSPLEL